MLRLEKRIGYFPRQQDFSNLPYDLERGVHIFFTGEAAGMARMGIGSSGMRGLFIRDFQTMQLHIHEDSNEKITGAKIKGKGKDGGEVPLTNYEAMMADLYADGFGFQKKKKLIKYPFIE